MSPPLKSRTLSAAIVDELREQILDGVQMPGAPLRQDALAARYGVSRIPVREALIQLEAEGLVQIAPHKGAVVTPLSRAEIRDVFELRAMLEPRLLARSIPALTAADLAALDTIQAAFSVAVRARDRGRWGALNAELHMLMYARADLPRTRAIVAGLLQTSKRYTRLQMASDAAWQRATREHALLIGHCRRQEVAAAVALLVQHITQVQHDLEVLIAAASPPAE